MGLSDGEGISMIRLAVLLQYTRVTDRRTDRQTELAWYMRYSYRFLVFLTDRTHRYCYGTTALTTQSILLTKIVHGTCDCVGIIARVQHIDGPLEVKYWGIGPL